MRFLSDASEVITAFNGEIEEIANSYLSAVYINRILVIAIIICICIMRKRKKNNFYTLDSENDAKLKKICTWESRAKNDQVKHIIKQYIDHYTRVHNINWEEHL